MDSMGSPQAEMDAHRDAPAGPGDAEGLQTAGGPRKGIRMIAIGIGVVVGAGLGFALYRYVGCASGACPITANPWISTIYGAVFGALFAASLRG